MSDLRCGVGEVWLGLALGSWPLGTHSSHLSIVRVCLNGKVKFWVGGIITLIERL